MATQKPVKQSKVSSYMEATIRTLINVKDFYVNGMAQCSEQIGYRTVMGCPMGQFMPVSSTISNNNNYVDHNKQFKTAASKRCLNSLPRKSQRSSITGVGSKFPRIYSVATVGMERIDEENSCDFGEDVKVRSRSCAVPRNTIMF